METISGTLTKSRLKRKCLLRTSIREIDAAAIRDLLHDHQNEEVVDGEEDGLSADVVLDVLNERDEASEWGLSRFLSLCEGNVSSKTSTMSLLIKYLRQHDRLAAIIDAPAPDGATPLYISCEKGNVEFARLLVVEGCADVNKAMNDGVTPLLFFVCHEGHVEFARLLIKRGADVDKAMNKG